MRKWEDIIKDKMEEPEGALPESVFAEFCNYTKIIKDDENKSEDNDGDH